jgi:hypothetical protein
VVAQAHRVRASEALTAFTIALAVSLRALMPNMRVGWTALAVSVLGLLFVVASLLSLRRVRHAQAGPLRDTFFLAGLARTFAVQLIASVASLAHQHETGPIQTIAILVIVCFLIGITRSWELIGGPSIRLAPELAAISRARAERDT